MDEKQLAAAIEQAKASAKPMSVYDAMEALNRASSHFNRAGAYDLANHLTEIGIRLMFAIQQGS